VCPAPLLNVWRDEFARHGPHARPYFVHGPRRIAGSWDETILNVTSYGTCVNDLQDWLISPPDVLILDESQCIKNRGADRSKAVRRLATRVQFVVLMTGTPMPNGYEDLWAQLYAMDPDLLGDRNTFLSAYCEFGGYEDKEVVGYRNLPLLHEIMRRSCIVVKKADCLDLPPKVYQTVNLTPTKEQNKRSNLAMQGVCGEEPITCSLTRIQKLRQIASGFVYQKQYTEEGEEDGTLVEEFETPKRNFLMETSFGLPTIIWTNYVREITDIGNILTEKGVSFSISDGRHNAYEEAMRFERGEVQVLLAQMQSIQYGFTLNRAEDVIYYSGSYDAMQREQTEDRCHRIGQTKSVRYRTLVCGDIEKIMLEACLAKIDVQDAVLNYIKNKSEKS
jgi:SNF2 family DNA or RNA helicase